MKRIKLLLVIIFILLINTDLYPQIINKTGYIYTEISEKISSMPSDSGNNYVEPNYLQLNTWQSTLDNLLQANYSRASDSANAIGYNLVCFTDTFAQDDVIYYILETADTNYWGTYVYNPNFCRPLIIQCPHSKKDANTGHQGIHVFRKTESMFFQVNGTNRCNSSVYSVCSGTTTGCNSSGNSEPYRISDLAHNTQSLFQKTTEVLFNSYSNTYFLQLHGFSKTTSDPYVILSNGTQQTPSVDYILDLKNYLYQEDTVLTFKIAHIDTNWTRLRGFYNTQGRLINNSPDYCDTNAVTTNGRFIHMEQERQRLRSNATAWNKLVNAINNTFYCSHISVDEQNIIAKLNVYPNPTQEYICIEWNSNAYFDQKNFIYNMLGQNISHLCLISSLQKSKALVNISKIPSGLYIVKVNNSISKIYKQ